MHVRRRLALQHTLTAIRHRVPIAEAGALILRNGERHLRRRHVLAKLYPEALLTKACASPRAALHAGRTSLPLSGGTRAGRPHPHQLVASADGGGCAGAGRRASEKVRKLVEGGVQVELDRRLEPHLRSLAERPNVSLHWGDALRLDLAVLRPAPTKLVANLPYNVATPIVAESLDRLPTIESWCVMVNAKSPTASLRCRRRRPTVRFRCWSSSRRVAPGSTRSRARSSGRRRTSTPHSSPSVASPCRAASATSAGSSKEHSPIVARHSRTRSSLPGSRHGTRPCRPSSISGSTRRACRGARAALVRRA